MIAFQVAVTLNFLVCVASVREQSLTTSLGFCRPRTGDIEITIVG